MELTRENQMLRDALIKMKNEISNSNNLTNINKESSTMKNKMIEKIFKECEEAVNKMNKRNLGESNVITK